MHKLKCSTCNGEKHTCMYDQWRSQWELWTVQLGGVPATLIGLERAVMYNGKHCIILKHLQDTEDRYHVQLENGRLLSVESKNVLPLRESHPNYYPITCRGATGRKEGMMNKEKAMQKKKQRKMSRTKRALAHWGKRSLTQGTPGLSKQSKSIIMENPKQSKPYENPEKGGMSK